jgi:hypothetical protein
VASDPSPRIEIFTALHRAKDGHSQQKGLFWWFEAIVSILTVLHLIPDATPHLHYLCL